MRKLITPIHFVIPLLLIITKVSLAQNQNIDEIILSIKAGSSRELAKYFDSSIELNMNDNQGDFSKNQAEIIFRDFFKKFPPEDFQVVHKGESTENIRYFIGNYESQDASFRVLIKSKLDRDQLRIYSMDFNRE